MLDWHSCQICYPLEIKILLLLLLKWHSDSYRTNPQTSEPAVIIRAALHDCLFSIFVICFQFFFFFCFFFFLRMVKDQTTCSLFSTTKTRQFISFQ